MSRGKGVAEPSGSCLIPTTGRSGRIDGVLDPLPSGALLIGRTATRLHLLLVLAMAAPAVIILTLIVAEAIQANDPHAFWVLGLIITAPVWMLGLVAVAEAVRVLRGGGVTTRRGLIYAFIGIAGGVLVAWTTGLVGLVQALLTRPQDVSLRWPEIFIRFADGSGGQSYPLNDAGHWISLLWLLLGIASLVAIVRTRRRPSLRGTGVTTGPA